MGMRVAFNLKWIKEEMKTIPSILNCMVRFNDASFVRSILFDSLSVSSIHKIKRPIPLRLAVSSILPFSLALSSRRQRFPFINTSSIQFMSPFKSFSSGLFAAFRSFFFASVQLPYLLPSVLLAFEFRGIVVSPPTSTQSVNFVKWSIKVGSVIRQKKVKNIFVGYDPSIFDHNGIYHKRKFRNSVENGKIWCPCIKCANYSKVDLNQWRKLVHHVFSEEGQKISKINRENRAKFEDVHCMGTKSLPKLIDEKKKMPMEDHQNVKRFTLKPVPVKMVQLSMKRLEE
ncbi:hypothetical protein QL285_051688 [Trifolium repens]|nr:hypothetical protein QL285_051688 [Trifolium repens]